MAASRGFSSSALSFYQWGNWGPKKRETCVKSCHGRSQIPETRCPDFKSWVSLAKCNRHHQSLGGTRRKGNQAKYDTYYVPIVPLCGYGRNTYFGRGIWHLVKQAQIENNSIINSTYKLSVHSLPSQCARCRDIQKNMTVMVSALTGFII